MWLLDNKYQQGKCYDWTIRVEWVWEECNFRFQKAQFGPGGPNPEKRVLLIPQPGCSFLQEEAGPFPLSVGHSRLQYFLLAFPCCRWKSTVFAVASSCIAVSHSLSVWDGCREWQGDDEDGLPGEKRPHRLYKGQHSLCLGRLRGKMRTRTM